MTDLRDALIAEMRKARIDHDRKKAGYASPYSGHDALLAYRDAWGYWCGLAKAVEVLDRFADETAPLGRCSKHEGDHIMRSSDRFVGSCCGGTWVPLAEDQS